MKQLCSGIKKMINQLSKIRVMGLRLCAGFEEAAVCYEKAFGEGLWLGSDCCPLLTASKKTGISVPQAAR